MRIRLVSACLLFASIGTAVVPDAKNIEKLSADCSKKGDPKTCGKLHDAIGKLTDQALLTKIAVEARDPVARRTAIAKIDDQTVLASIARSEREVEARKEAIEKLSDRGVYAAVLETETDPAIRALMAARLNAVVVAGNPVPGMEPLLAPNVLDSDSAWEAHLKLGWKVFRDYREWYETKLSSDQRWYWEASNAPKELSIASHGDDRLAPERGPFAVVAIEYMPKEYSLTTDRPSILIGDHFDPARLDNRSGPGRLDPWPVGRLKCCTGMAYTLTDDHRGVIMFYTKNAVASALWFVSGRDIGKEKFTLFLMKYKPIRFTIKASER
jgi:hypothetical protein